MVLTDQGCQYCPQNNHTTKEYSVPMTLNGCYVCIILCKSVQVQLMYRYCMQEWTSIITHTQHTHTHTHIHTHTHTHTRAYTPHTHTHTHTPYTHIHTHHTHTHIHTHTVTLTSHMHIKPLSGVHLDPNL